MAEKAPIPNADRAIIDPAKLYAYALNPSHPVGRNKARVFEAALGFNLGNAEDLVRQITQGLAAVDAAPGRTDEFGARFVADIPVIGPRGRGVVRTAWIIPSGSDTPVLTTMFVMP